MLRASCSRMSEPFIQPTLSEGLPFNNHFLFVGTVTDVHIVRTWLIMVPLAVSALTGFETRPILETRRTTAVPTKCPLSLKTSPGLEEHLIYIYTSEYEL